MHTPPDMTEQLAAYQSRFAEARRDEIFPFSAIQQSVLQWQVRDGFECITITGKYSAQALQDAFARLVCEQDLLRSIADERRLSWQLLATDASSIQVPVVELGTVAQEDLPWQLEWIADQLRACKRSSLLPYLAAWVSESDFRHHLMLAVDDLIWDAASSVVVHRRLADFLNGVPKPIIRTYRDYVHDSWRTADQEIYDQVHQRFDHPRIAGAEADTLRALEAHAHLQLQSVSLEAPLTHGSTAAEKAFSGFKHWLLQFTGLPRFAMVLYHSGRQLGANSYFDHVGQFLDKIPFAVTSSTGLQELTCKAGYLQKLGVNYMTLEGDSAIRRVPTLPHPQQEVVFNFQPPPAPESARRNTPFATAALERKFPGYIGVHFESYARPGGLVVQCAFRGDANQIDEFLGQVPGSRLIEAEPPASVTRPKTPHSHH